MQETTEYMQMEVLKAENQTLIYLGFQDFHDSEELIYSEIRFGVFR